MPGATKGEIKAFGYMYWVNATAEEVETFYTEQMKQFGWPLVKHTNVLSWYGRGNSYNSNRNTVMHSLMLYLSLILKIIL
jgi:hypothetical protein